MKEIHWVMIAVIIVMVMLYSLKARRAKKKGSRAPVICEPLPGEPLPYTRIRGEIGGAVAGNGTFWAASSVHTQQTMLFSYLYQYVRYCCAKRLLEVLEEKGAAGEAFAKDPRSRLLAERLLLRLIPEIEAPLEGMDKLMRKCAAMDLSATSAPSRRSQLLEQEIAGTGLAADLLAYWSQRREEAVASLREAGQSAPDREADKAHSAFPKSYQENSQGLRQRLQDLLVPTLDTPHTSGEHLRYLIESIGMAETCSRGIQAEMASSRALAGEAASYAKETLRLMTQAFFDVLAQYLNSESLTWTLAKGESEDLKKVIPALFDQAKHLAEELRSVTFSSLE